MIFETTLPFEQLWRTRDFSLKSKKKQSYSINSRTSRRERPFSCKRPISCKKSKVPFSCKRPFSCKSRNLHEIGLLHENGTFDFLHENGTF